MALVGWGVGARGEGVGVLRPGTGACEPGVGWVVRGAGAGDWVQLTSHNPQKTSQPNKKTRWGCNFSLSGADAPSVWEDRCNFPIMDSISTAFQSPYSLSPSRRPSKGTAARHLHPSQGAMQGKPVSRICAGLMKCPAPLPCTDELTKGKIYNLFSGY